MEFYVTDANQQTSKSLCMFIHSDPEINTERPQGYIVGDGGSCPSSTGANPTVPTGGSNGTSLVSTRLKWNALQVD